MTIGADSRVESAAIRDAVQILRTRLGDCVRSVRYRNSAGGEFEPMAAGVRAARLTLTSGIASTGGRLDIRWWYNGDYVYEYHEDGLRFVFGRDSTEQGTPASDLYFRPPSDPDQRRPSTFDPDFSPELVTLAVAANWVVAARQEDPTILNEPTVYCA